MAHRAASRALLCFVVAPVALVGCAAQPGPQEPTSSPIAQSETPGEYPVFDGSWDEWAQAYLTCLRDEGWNAELGDPDEGISFSFGVVDESQTGALLASQERCNQRVGRIPEPTLDDAALTRVYEALVDQHDCLAEAGFTPEEPPSLEVYIDRQKQGIATWDPMLGVGENDYDAALDACPRPGPVA